MSSYKNNVHLEGNLGKDAEKKSTPNGDVVNCIRQSNRIC
jgi:single-stranded DNA-binding protein